MFRIAGVVLPALTVACLSGPPESADPLDSEAGVLEWSYRASVFGVLVPISSPIQAANGEDTYVDPDCPFTSDDGTTLTVAADCIDQTGASWKGSARVVSGDGGDLHATYDGFGRLQSSDELITGSVDVHLFDDTHASFEVDAVWKNAESSTEVVYTGDVRTESGQWANASGSGSFMRSGGTAAGLVEAETRDELLDANICPIGAVSGSTTLESPGHTVVITYDGLTDCDLAAAWTVDGDDRGILDGVGCSAGGGEAGGLASLVVLLAIALVSRRRRSPGPAR